MKVNVTNLWSNDEFDPDNGEFFEVYLEFQNINS
jgi:hypothetical protein